MEVCSFCNQERKTNTKNPTYAHKFSYTYDPEPTDYTPGVKIGTCKTCGVTQNPQPAAPKKAKSQSSTFYYGTEKWHGFYWCITADGTMVFTGEGSMEDLQSGERRPWDTFVAQEVTALVFDNRITHIASYLCYAMNGVTSITLPTGLESIGESAFGGCRMKNIALPDSLQAIGDYAFLNTSLTEVTLPASLVSLGNFVFSECASLQSVTYLNSQIALSGSYIFQNCTALESLPLPEGAETIPTGFVKGCTSICQISIPRSVHTIGDQAFAETGMRSLTIPENVTLIGTDICADCPDLLQIINLSQLPSSTFPDTVYVAESAADTRLTEENGFVFFTTINGEGILVGCNTDQETLALPESYRFGDSVVSLCKVRAGAFNGWRAQTRLLHIPKNTSIRYANDLFTGKDTLPQTVYFPGSQEEFDLLGLQFYVNNQRKVDMQRKSDGGQLFQLIGEGTTTGGVSYRRYSEVLYLFGTTAITSDNLPQITSQYESSLKYVVISPDIPQIGYNALKYSESKVTLIYLFEESAEGTATNPGPYHYASRYDPTFFG